MGRQPGEGAETTEEAADPCEVGADSDSRLESSGLDEVGGHEACRHPSGVTDGGDQVKLLSCHVIICRSLHNVKIKLCFFTFNLSHEEN